MLSVADCRSIAERIPDYIDGQLPSGERVQMEGHLLSCQACRHAVKRIREVQNFVRGALGPETLNPEFAQETSKKLQAVHPEALPPLDERVLAGLRPETFLDKLPRRLGGAPWWVLSGAFHALLLLLLTLIGMAYLGAQQEDVVIMTNLEQKKEPEKIKKPLKRDVFRKPEINATEITDVQTPVVMHEEVEVAETVETENESDARAAVGDEGISDVPLGGVGSVAALGLGGGGRSGAFGRPSGAGGRLRRATKNGGSKKTESAVNAGLEWLARNQEPDGHWDSKKFGGDQKRASGDRTDVAVTGMALLAFLGAGHTEKIGKYKENVQRAVGWLIGHQMEDGSLSHNKGGGYGHAIAGMALSEAAGMARLPKTLEAAQKAVDRDTGKGTKWEEESERFGWTYYPYQLNKLKGDISNSGWHIMFIKSAKVAGLHVRPESIEGLLKFLDSVEHGKKAGDPYSGHRYGYKPEGKGTTPRRTAIGCLCRLFFGTKPDELRGGVDYMIEKGGSPKVQGKGGIDLYYTYYGTLVAFQMGGEIWKKWNGALKTALLPHQVKGGKDDGSWNPIGRFSLNWGRVGQTAMSILCLEVYYRYLPMYR